MGSSIIFLLFRILCSPDIYLQNVNTAAWCSFVAELRFCIKPVPENGNSYYKLMARALREWGCCAYIKKSRTNYKNTEDVEIHICRLEETNSYVAA